MNEQLTNKDFWKNYWNNKTDLIFKIPAKFPFLKELEDIIQKNSTKKLLEIGGFPGYYSIWIKKNLGVDSTLLDFIIIPEITKSLEEKNELVDSVELLEVDLFNESNQAMENYDLVFSNGLIEHFENTKDIIQRHLNYLKVGGDLLITIPNFRGYNGLIQLIFDKENLNKHYLPCMDIQYLKNTCEDLKLSNIEVEYNGEFTIWLEDQKNKPIWKKMMRFILWLPFKIIFKFVPTKGKFFSPYIIIKAKKS
ncbi:MAG: hypothetical protein RIR51_1329 [Bacteroidota bacterium]|jgi:SAM-dependent methyltransferase